MSEPNAGSDVVSMKLKAEKKGKATCHKAGGGLCWVPSMASQQGGSSYQTGWLKQDRRLQPTASGLLSLRRSLRSEWQQVLDHQWP